MSKTLLALEVHGPRAVVAAIVADADSIRLSHIVAIESEDPTPAAVGRTLAAAIAEHKLPRGEVLLCFSRGDLECRWLTLPPCPEAELATMVRFSFAQECSQLRDEWPLDFLPLEDDTTGPRRVLAVAIDPEDLATAQAVAQAAGLRARHATLRSLGLMAWAERGPRIVAATGIDELDVVFVAHGRPEIVRTTRLPGDAAQRRFIQSEVKRTLAAARNRAPGGELGQADLVLLARTDLPETLAADLEQATQLPSEQLNAVASLGWTCDERVDPALSAGAAAMLGLLAQQARGQALALDLLAPRKAPPPPSRARSYAWGGVAAAALAAVVGIFLWQQLASLDAEISDLKKEIASYTPYESRWRDIQQQAGQVAEWADQEIVWLDELHQLAKSLPESQKVMLMQLAAATSTEGGRVQLDGVASQSGVVAELERGLRGERHQVSTQGGQEVPQGNRYKWRFQSTLVITPRGEDLTAEEAVAEEGTADDAVAGEPPSDDTAADPIATANPIADDARQREGVARRND